MPEPRWRDVDMKTGSCSHCGGMHYGSGMECPFREENMGEPCVLCGERTCYCCSDCAIDGAGKVYVCTKDACRTEHEKKHDKLGSDAHVAQIESRHRSSAPFQGRSVPEQQYNIVREDRAFLLAEVKRLKDELYMRTRTLEEEMKRADTTYDPR